MAYEFLEALPVPSIVIGPDDTLVGANAASATLFAQLGIGRSYLTVFRQANLIDLIETIRATGARGSTVLAFRGGDKGTFNVTGSVLGEGEILLCLQDMNETAAAVEMRQNFAADLGHELRTPLTAISGILETCEGDDGALAQFLPVMTSEVERMKRLVDDLLTLSRVEVNERRTPDQTVVLQSLIAAACAPLEILAGQRGVRIETVVPEAPIQFQGDADEIVRAIRNLVENAVRYSDASGVVRVAGCVVAPVSDTGSAYISIVIMDKGPGVEAHHIPRLTERFYRVDDHRSRDVGGSGLGLAIVKHIVGHHRGKMTIESRVGEGSTVTLLLPLEHETRLP